MATDLFGKPIGGYPQYRLSLQQKRQATLLYHWMSQDYLKGLLAMIDALIKGADVNLELAKRQGRDALLTNSRWGVSDTSANWSTHVFPALEDFRKSTIRDIALRANESYEFTGANQCGRMISEFSSMWMTPEEEERFRQQWEAVYHYAGKIDAAAGSGGQRRMITDFSMTLDWQEDGHLFSRLPKLRVRTDVEAVTGKKPLRTGVYVAQDDPHAALQFAWTGNDDGVLGEARTFSDVGQRLLAAVGREGLWIDDAKLAPIAIREIERNAALDTGGTSIAEIRAHPEFASGAMAFAAAFTTRPCKWYFVEKIDGEFDEDAQDSSEVSTQPSSGLRCEAGQPCPREGFWFTPAKPDSRRHFKQGELMPSLGGDYGLTIWQWDARQD